MQSKAKRSAQLQQLRQRIEGSPARGPNRGDDRSDIALSQAKVQARHIDATVRGERNGLEPKAEDLANPTMRVMGLLRSQDHAVGVELSGNPQCFQVRHRPATREVSQVPW